MFKKFFESRRRDLSWLRKYKLEDYKRERVTIIDFNSIYGLWRTRDDLHSVGIFLSGPAYFVYYFDGTICDYFSGRVYIDVPFFRDFEKLLMETYDEIHQDKREIESKFI